MNNYRVLQSKFAHPSDALSFVSEILPPCPPNSVRVQLEARTINPSDILSVFGEGQYKYNHIPPRTPGFEGAGVVIESNIASYKKGDRVLVAKEGCWQKYIDVGKYDLFRIPVEMDTSYAAQLYINPLTSWLLIQFYVEKNESPIVALNAANSTMGRLMLQLLKKLDVETIAITRQTNSEELHALGASHVLSANHSLIEQMKARNISKPNIVFDAVGGDAATELVRGLSFDGTYVIYGCLSMQGHDAEFFLNVKEKSISTNRFFLGDWKDRSSHAEKQKIFYKMLFYFIENTIQMPVSKVFKLTDYASAIEFSMNTDRASGKVILSN